MRLFSGPNRTAGTRWPLANWQTSTSTGNKIHVSFAKSRPCFSIDPIICRLPSRSHEPPHSLQLFLLQSVESSDSFQLPAADRLQQACQLLVYLPRYHWRINVGAMHCTLECFRARVARNFSANTSEQIRMRRGDDGYPILSWWMSLADQDDVDRYRAWS